MEDPCMKQVPLCKRFSTLAGAIIIFTIWRNIYPFPFWKYSLTATSGSGEDFLISSMYFRYFVIISPWKRAGSFIWTNLNPLNLRMHCSKFGWSWPSGSGEEDFLIYDNAFSLFRNYWKRITFGDVFFERIWRLNTSAKSST